MDSGSQGSLPAIAELVPIDRILPADSPRLGGQDADHSILLAEADRPLPPILVHRQTMRVVDGMHRLAAAILRGDRQIAVRYFDGDNDAAFVAAVHANTTHGLPLCLADREAAAIRIAAARPEWSNGVIAEIAGLAVATVAALRRRQAHQLPNPGERIGRDGKVRPLSSVEGRRRAGRIIACQPGASLRDVARQAGISVGTARDVRNRVHRGEDPVPDGALPQTKESRAVPKRVPRQPVKDQPVPRTDQHRVGDNQQHVLHEIQRDPAMRFNLTGRLLLRCLSLHAMSDEHWEKFADAVPDRWAQAVADLAIGCATGWTRFASRLTEHDIDRQHPDVAFVEADSD
jgi:hypothetical protein